MSESRARILFIDSGVFMAGGQHSLVEILKCLDRSRFSPYVCSPGRSGLRLECNRLGVPWRPLPFESETRFARRSSRLLWKAGDMLISIYGLFRLVHLIHRLRIRIVHANNFKAALVAGPACLLAGRPMVFHDRIHLTHGLLGRVVQALSARTIAVSLNVARKFGTQPGPGVRVIPPGIDVAVFEPGPGGGGCLVGYLGRLSEEKGIRRLVECVPAVLDEVPAAGFIIGGMACTDRDSAYLADLKERVGALGLTGKILFPGRIDDAPDFLRALDVFVLPSVREPLGRVMIEAMLMEKPVVAFNAGGPAEVLSHGETGLLAEPGDSGGLARNIVLLLGDPGLREMIGRKARQSVKDRFSNRRVGESIMEVYEELLEKGEHLRDL
jgi:glycosyltransferase involved in cell wall biosynthesis